MASVMLKWVTGLFAVRTVAKFGLRNENEISTVTEYKLLAKLVNSKSMVIKSRTAWEQHTAHGEDIAHRAVSGKL